MSSTDINRFLRELDKHVILDNSPELGKLFDEAMQTSIVKLKKEIGEMTTSYRKLETRQTELSEQYEKTGVPIKSDISVLEDLGDLSMEIGYLEENLNSVLEMKVVNLYKDLEIRTKIMLTRAYTDIDEKDFYRWDVLINFLKSKNITPSSLDGYVETDQLRKVNNQIKHGGKLGQKNQEHS